MEGNLAHGLQDQVNEMKSYTKKRVGIQVSTILDRLNICLYEFIGTAMVVLGYNFTNLGQAVSFNLFVAILLAQKISGAMFNPAITVGIYMTLGSFCQDLQLIIMIICFQILGSYFGIILGHICMGEPAFLCPYQKRAGCLIYDDNDEWIKVFLLEFQCSFFYTLCYLCQIIIGIQDSVDGTLQAAAISLTLYSMITFAGPISGGCFNPAFGITQTTYQVGYMNSLGIDGKIYQRYLWIYATAPLLGGIVAAMFVRYIHLRALNIQLNKEDVKQPLQIEQQEESSYSVEELYMEEPEERKGQKKHRL